MSNIKWVKIWDTDTRNRDYVGIELDNAKYIYYFRNEKDTTIIGKTHKKPLDLTNSDEIQQIIKDKGQCNLYKVQQLKQELEDALKEPKKPPVINSDYIPGELKKHDGNILAMLNSNIPEYVGDKTNLLMLILSVVAARTGLASYIINITGESLAGKTTLIETLFKLVPGDIILYHGNSTMAGLVRSYRDYNISFNGNILYLGDITNTRKKELTKILEELIINLYKHKRYTADKGAKTTTENSINVNIQTDTIITLFKSIEPLNIAKQINDITTYLTVKPVPRKELVKELQINNAKNNQEFIEQHQHYIASLSDNSNIKEVLYQNTELISYIDKNTIDLSYEELTKYQMLYCSYCIYLDITPSIESFKDFQELTPRNTVLSDIEKELIKFLNKHYTNDNITLSSKNRSNFKYFRLDMLTSYHGTIKVIKELGNLEELEGLINSLIAKEKIGIKEPGLYYLITPG